VIASAHGPRCVAADAVAGEIARHIPRLASKRCLDPTLLFAALQVMPIEWKAAHEYNAHREEAERRIADRDPERAGDVRPHGRKRTAEDSGHQTRATSCQSEDGVI
jgi:hypothetical protein